MCLVGLWWRPEIRNRAVWHTAGAQSVVRDPDLQWVRHPPRLLPPLTMEN